MIELFVPTFNEEWMLPRMIEFYRTRIPDIVINVHDNGSTDRTVEIAKDLDCNVVHWETGGELRDDLLTDWKNSIWKGSKAELVVVCDADEWLDYWPGSFDAANYLAYKNVCFICEGYDMVAENKGVRNPLYDKILMFSPKIGDMNYGLGAHTASPSVGTGHGPRLFHMKYTMPVDLLVKKYKAVSERMSELNKEHGWGFHYNFDEETIRRQYAEMLIQAKPI